MSDVCSWVKFIHYSIKQLSWYGFLFLQQFYSSVKYLMFIRFSFNKLLVMFHMPTYGFDDWSNFVRMRTLFCINKLLSGVSKANVQYLLVFQGGILHIFVDKTSHQGNVYVKCVNVHAAVAAVNSLHGRWFAGDYDLQFCSFPPF
jgi:hypothetical protein